MSHIHPDQSPSTVPASMATQELEAGVIFYSGKHCGSEIDNRERGGATIKLALAAFVLGTAAVAGNVAGSALAAWSNVQPRVVENAQESVIKVVDLAVEPIQLDCRATTISNAAGSRRVYDRKVANKTIPNASSVVDFSKYIVTSTDCAKGGSTEQGSYTGAVVIETGDPRIGSTYKTKTIQIPTDQMVRITGPVVGPDTDIVTVKHDDLIEAMFSGNALGSIAFKAACNVVSVGQAGEVCNNIADSFGKKPRAEVDASLRASAEAWVLEAVRRQCGAVSWPNTRKVIIDSYKNEAVKLAGGDSAAADAVTVVFTKNGSPTDEPPAFSSPYDDQLKKLGLVVPSEELTIDDTLKVGCETPKPYVSTYPEATPTSTPTRTLTGATK